MTVATNASLAEYRIDGRVHRLRRVGQCHVCRSKFRPQVEMALVAGESYKAIVEGLPEESALSIRNVAEHMKRGHLPVENELFRQIREEQAEQVGQLVQSAVDRKMGELGLARSVVERVTERLAVGELQPTMREGIASAKLLARYDGIRMERDELRRQRDEAQTALRQILASAKSLMSGKSWTTLGQQVDADPALRAFWPAPTG